MKHDDIRRLVESRWHGLPVASTQQLADAGLDERVLTAGVSSGVLLRLRRGAYVRADEWNRMAPWQRDGLRIDAHYESTGGSALYSHTSSARLHGCQVWDAGAHVHVITSYANAATSSGADVRTHRLAISAAQTTSLLTADGREFRVTTLERTVLDCARILGLAQAAVIGDSALRQGADLARLHQQLEDSPLKRGSRRAERLLEALDARSESAGETRTRLLLRSFGLDAVVPQFEIHTSSGLFRADFADPASRVVIEFDGKGKYGDYKPADQVLLAERRRENALSEDGWTFLRLEWSQLDRPAELRRRVFATLARAGQKRWAG
jgi:very-short-patch-repair endonuclease